MNELLTIKEAASYVRVNPLTVYRLASRGKVPAVKVGRHWRVHRDALEIGPIGVMKKPFGSRDIEQVVNSFSLKTGRRPGGN